MVLPDLSGFVCLVTGASRGIGKGIATSLCKAGATVYITGRTMEPVTSGIGGSLKQTASELAQYSGKTIPVQVDHSDENQVRDLFNRIDREQNGRLDLLVNNAYSAVPFLIRNMSKPFYEINECSPGEAWDVVNNTGLRNSYICSVLATRLMLKTRSNSTNTNLSHPGLIVNISSAGSKMYLFGVLYGVGKTAIDRMTSDMARELKTSNANVTVMSLWPGLVSTETIVECVRTKVADINLDLAESPELSGEVIAHMAADSTSKLLSRSGKIFLTCDLADQYKISQSGGYPVKNIRSLRVMAEHKAPTIAKFIPGFIYVPKSFLMWSFGKL